jgi:hypothetical protein
VRKIWRLSFSTVSAATLLLLTSARVLAQTYQPAIEYQSLMNMRYYQADGGFLIEDLQLVFPPARIGMQSWSFLIYPGRLLTVGGRILSHIWLAPDATGCGLITNAISGYCR